jgi:2-polyprenyl-3-methyl-5-hydroxy-6-metoxy-1,4-benzoquinol methylase
MGRKNMFKLLEKINARPKPFEFYTAEELWADEHTSKMMLAFHLDEAVDISSRKGEFTDRSVAWIARRFDVDTETYIADFGCGPGLYTTRLAERGARVTGVDFSVRSIEHAQKIAEERGLDIDYVHRNYLDFETDKRFDLISMIMCDYCALSPMQRKLMLKNFYRLLKPGGSVLLDVYSLNTYDQKKESASYEVNQLNSFWSADKYYGFVNTFKYDVEKLTLDKYTLIEKNRTRVVYNWLQHFSRESLEEEFVGSGFSIDGVYSDVAGKEFSPDSPEIAIVAQKSIR